MEWRPPEGGPQQYKTQARDLSAWYLPLGGLLAARRGTQVNTNGEFYRRLVLRESEDDRGEVLS